jgi:hypothetical protein
MPILRNCDNSPAVSHPETIPEATVGPADEDDLAKQSSPLRIK